MNHIAVQMYTLRHLFMPVGQGRMALDDLLAAIAAAGYSGIETFGPLEPPAPEMRALLDKHGLVVCSAHVLLDALEQDLEGVVAYHKALGNDTLIVPWLHPEQRPQSTEGWRALGQRLDALGATCAAHGMRLLYHNHDFEMAPTDDGTAMDSMLLAADPAHFGAEVDIGWVIVGGSDPLAMLQRMHGRVPFIHVKDLARPGENLDQHGQTDLGEGTVDWETILPAARDAGVQWLVMEHDEPADPLTTLRKGMEYLNGRWE